MQKISIVNSKGGTGKTTTSLFLWQELNRRGYRSLLIDLDPSRNASTTTNIPETQPSIYDVLSESAEPAQAIYKTKSGDAIRGSRQTANPELLAPVNAYLLKAALDKISGYDFIIMDTPPTPPDTSGIINNALICSDAVIIVTDPEKYGLQGVLDELEIIDRVKKFLNPGLTVSGILINKCKMFTNHHKKYVELIKSNAAVCNVPVYNSMIRNAVAVGRVEDEPDKPLFSNLNNENVAADFSAFVDEFIKREVK